MTSIAPQTMARYRETARAREAGLQQVADARRMAAWSVARRAARLLHDEFGATRVIVFGSLAHGGWFGPRSDVDLAAEGIPPDAFWRAWIAVDQLDPAVEVDLVALEAAPEVLRAEIMTQGVAL